MKKKTVIFTVIFLTMFRNMWALTCHSLWRIDIIDYKLITFFSSPSCNTVTECIIKSARKENCDGLSNQRENAPRFTWNCLRKKGVDVEGFNNFSNVDHPLQNLKRMEDIDKYPLSGGGVTSTKYNLPCKIAEELQLVSRGKPTSQSSVITSGKRRPSEFAVDGDKNQHGMYCAITQRDDLTWWRVDLTETYLIYSVTIWSRNDCCYNHLQNFTIKAGFQEDPLSSSNALCAYQARGMIKAEIREYVCIDWPISGRYVTVHKYKNYNLNLCEVEVKALKNKEY